MPNGSVLPHLTSEELSERDYEETLLNKELYKCWSRDDVFDGERAEHVLSDYAVRIFRVLHSAYKARAAFREDWLKEIRHRAIYRTLRVYSGHSAYGMPTLEELGDDLGKAIDEYLQNLAPQISALAIQDSQQVSGYAKAGIDVASASPLLMAAINAAQEPAKREPIRSQIRRLREECHMTNEQLAEAIGTDRRSVVRHISGQYVPSKKHIVKYERLFSERLGRAVRIETSL